MVDAHFNPEDSQLIADLHRISKKSPKLIRSTVYTAPSDPSVHVRSWKMNEFKYRDVPSPFPTLARGLFTRELVKALRSDEPRYEIVARGYDKFFNIGEVPWTDWESLRAHTGPDYTLSVKSNGCIVFIASISPSKLIVSSKHALGGMDGVLETHSQVGHRWLLKHLASKGKTEEQLAAFLWKKNWTAVAELCDDNFEEHVLAYPPEKSGLYLHGINENSKAFHTLPTEIINSFADGWGFLKTATLVFNTLPKVKEFTDEIAKTGKWNGEPLEGFVVRTHIVDPKPGSTSHDKRPPYPTGSSFFFKVKFDEPYMMYRDWREVTKSLLSTKGSLHDAKLPSSKMKRMETKLYVQWVKSEINKNRNAFEGYQHGKGIIATRERFLKWLSTEQDKTDLVALEKPRRTAMEFGKTIIMPIAIPGCGKTTVSIALAHLFRFGHTQSDDVQAKKTAPAFVKNVVNLLKDHEVVIADKNNHLRQHRQALRKAVVRVHPPVRLVALHWALDQPQTTIHRICSDRILSRGNNHQTLRADPERKSYEDVLWRFIRDSQELADDEADNTILMVIDETLEAAVNRAVDGCVRILGLKRPTVECIHDAIALAKSYEPSSTKQDPKAIAKPQPPPAPRYYALLPDIDVESLVHRAMNDGADDVPYNGRTFWDRLVKDKRVTQRPHVTIAHKAGLPHHMDLWERCMVLDRMPIPPSFSFRLGHLVWNDRVMAITVDDVDVDAGVDTDPGQEKHEFVSALPADLRVSLHITVGTANTDILPFEAKALVTAWRYGKRMGQLALGGLRTTGRIEGLMS